MDDSKSQVVVDSHWLVAVVEGYLASPLLADS